MLNAIVWMKRKDDHFDEIINDLYGHKMTWQRAQSFDDVLSFLSTEETFHLVITILDPSDIEILYQIKLCQQKSPSLSMIAIFDTSDVASIDQALGLILGNVQLKNNALDQQHSNLHHQDESSSQVTLNADLGNDISAHDSFSPHDSVPVNCHLTPRQKDVLGLIMVGKSNKEIARDLALSEGTVKVHCMALFKEMSVSNRTQAALMAEKLLRA